MKDDGLILDVRNLIVHYETEEGCVEAVNGINIKLGRQLTLGLVGETGAGKTTAALAMLRLVPDPPGVIKDGEIYLDGEDILKKTPRELEKIRGKDIAMIFQDPMTSLNPVFTVEEQIAESILLHEDVTKTEAEERARDMLELVGIPRFRSKEYPHQFSGGMKQRVVIATALACTPDLIIADEPTTALDVTIQAQVLELMKQIKNNNNTSMIMITHDLGIVAEVCDKIAVIYAGNVIEYGTREDIFNHHMHPYTEGLFNCIPDLSKEESKLIPIKGLMPDPSKLPNGCKFHPRCPYAIAKCCEEEPLVIEVSDGHTVKCFLPHQK